MVGGCVGTKVGEDTLNDKGTGVLGVGVLGVRVGLCFGGGDGVGSMYDGTGSAHIDLCGGGDGDGSMCGGTGSAHGSLWSSSLQLNLSRSRRKSALLCLAGLKSVFGVTYVIK